MTHGRRSSRPAHHGVTWHGRRSLITRRPGPGRSSRPAAAPSPFVQDGGAGGAASSAAAAAAAAVRGLRAARPPAAPAP